MKPMSFTSTNQILNLLTFMDPPDGFYIVFLSFLPIIKHFDEEYCIRLWKIEGHYCALTKGFSIFFRNFSYTVFFSFFSFINLFIHENNNLNILRIHMILYVNSRFPETYFPQVLSWSQFSYIKLTGITVKNSLRDIFYWILFVCKL